MRGKIVLSSVMMRNYSHAHTWNEKFEVIVQGIEMVGAITSCSPSKNTPLICIPAHVATQATLKKPAPARIKL